MKKTLLLLALTGSILSGCTDHDHKPNKNCVEVHKYHHPMGGGETFCEYISVDSANVMINSFLGSINNPQDSNDLHSLDYNADSLRAYLSDQRVTGVKFMFAHTLSYINSGGKDQYAGYQSGALTLVIAGYDAQGNYVFFYYPQSQTPMVKDHCMPCPNSCPAQGSAASDTLITQPTSKR